MSHNVGMPFDMTDPTAAPQWSAEDTHMQDTPNASSDPLAFLEHWTPEQGIADSTGTIRVWTDEAGVPYKSQLSRYWKQRVKEYRLQDMCSDLFLRLSLVVDPPVLTSDDEVDIDTDELLTPDLLDQIDQRVSEITERFESLAEDEGFGTWHGAPTAGHDPKHNVVVELSPFGRPVTAQFAEQWLETASTAEVQAAFVAAWRDAHENFVAPHLEPGERDALCHELVTLNTRLQRALMNGLA